MPKQIPLLCVRQKMPIYQSAFLRDGISISRDKKDHLISSFFMPKNSYISKQREKETPDLFTNMF